MAGLETYFPWIKKPVIINAPMAGFAGGALASVVTLAGGFGLIGSAMDMDQLRDQLEIAKDRLKGSSFWQETTHDRNILPIGIGFLPFIVDIEQALPIVQEYTPAVAWLFAAKELNDYSVWARRIREVSPKTKVWVQVGNVDAALRIAHTAHPDALCLQGVDAGGHGFEKSAGIISLVPESVDALKRAGFANIGILASGGISDGRGVAAALALGAQGVVMGTRFLASEEVIVHPIYQAAVLEARDGGKVTVRSKVFDELKGPNIWPEGYDGRSIVVKSYADWAAGMGMEEIRKLHIEEAEREGKGYGTGGEGRAAIWAGTGVGLVSELQSAKRIVDNIREDVKTVFSTFGKMS